MGKQAKKIELKSPDTFSLIAIYTVNNDYRLAWLLNNVLNLQIQREDYSGEIELSLFSDRNSLAPIHFLLIENTPEVVKLFPNYEQVNYFLKVSNATEEQIQEAVGKIRKTESVSACSVLKANAKLLKFVSRL